MYVSNSTDLMYMFENLIISCCSLRPNTESKCKKRQGHMFLI
jgi:hypothetical protein